MDKNKAKSLDGEELTWRPHLNIKKILPENCSDLHNKAREIIKTNYPTCVLLEEVTIPVCRKEISYLDFYLPLMKIAVEVQGSQHFKFSLQYHENNRDLLWQQVKDRRKREWCELNHIRLIEFNYNETEQQWKNKLLQKTG